MSALATRTLTPSYPDTFRSPYSPGPVRRSTDSEFSAVSAFVGHHPEYGRLSHIELVTLAATYVGPEETAERTAIEEAGVPRDWCLPVDDEEKEEV